MDRTGKARHFLLARTLAAARSNPGLVALLGFNYSAAALGFAASFIFARYLPTEEYGSLSYCLFVSQIVFVLVSFGGERTLVRDLIQRRDQSRILFASCLKTVLVSAVALPAVIAVSRLQSNDSTQISAAIIYSVAGVLLALAPKALFDAREQMALHSSILFGEKVLFVLFTLTLMAISPDMRSLLVVALVFITTRVLAFTIQWCLARPKLPGDFAAVWKATKMLFRENSAIFAASAGNLVMTHATPMLLSSHGGREELAYYGIAFQIVVGTQLLQTQVVRFVAPGIARTTADTADATIAKSLFRRLLLYAFVGTAITAIAGAVFGRYAILLLLPENYSNSVPILFVLSLWCLVMGPALVVNQFLLGLRLNNQYLVATTLAAALSIGLALVLIPKFGGLGCALALLTAHSVSVAYQWWCVISRFYDSQPRPVS